MNQHTLEPWQHSHRFIGESARSERRTAQVMLLAGAMMVVEIVAGMVFGSMALLADGWHMATHVAAFGIALYAYRYARSHADSPRYTFGTGKVGVLGGYASAVALAAVALVMALESVMRIVEPREIHFNQAIGVAVAGLLVNLVSGWMLSGRAGHAHDHEHGAAPAHEHEHLHEHDHNLRAAYVHVLADALTSVFAIAALLAGMFWGWVWLDPVMGLAGAAVIARWSYGLLRETGHILLDGAVDESTQAAIRRAIEGEADNMIADLHVWHVGPRHYAVSVSVVTHQTRTPEHYKRLLEDIPRLAHVVVEVNPCPGEVCGGEGAATGAAQGE